jgi:DNA (cytosine-5)-methyltransferase 1
VKKPISVDLFAGGGGASKGTEAATGQPVGVAINHSPVAIAVHKANHPKTKHFTTDIWEVNPVEACNGHPVSHLHASPDCTHFSRAKGNVPKSQNIRSLADVVIVWAEAVKPLVITLENVPEFPTWGPLHPPDAGINANRPIKERAGEEFNRWCGELRALGYVIDHRVLDASLFGAPTKRKRFFLVARRDGRPITWPETTHGPGKLPLRTAAECIDWNLPCPSIFDRERPLAEKTLKRIAAGIKRFVLDNPQPFVVGVGGRAGQTPPTAANAPVGTVTAKNDRAVVVPYMVPVNHGGGEDRAESGEAPLSTICAARRSHALVAPTLIQTGYGERPGQKPRVLDLHEPLGTAVNGQKHGLVTAFLAKHFGGVVGHEFTRPIGTVTAVDHHSVVTSTLVKFRGDPDTHDPALDLNEPLPTVTAGGNHVAEVRAFLAAFYGEGSGQKGHPVSEPLPTATTKDRFGLVVVNGIEHQIVDIGMRMLQPEELLRAQFGRFAEGYDLSAAKTKAAKVRLIGNSVCPEVQEALVRANLPDLTRLAA